MTLSLKKISTFTVNLVVGIIYIYIYIYIFFFLFYFFFFFVGTSILLDVSS